MSASCMYYLHMSMRGTLFFYSISFLLECTRALNVNYRSNGLWNKLNATYTNQFRLNQISRLCGIQVGGRQGPQMPPICPTYMCIVIGQSRLWTQSKAPDVSLNKNLNLHCLVQFGVRNGIKRDFTIELN